jgi:hypothetical protein
MKQLHLQKEALRGKAPKEPGNQDPVTVPVRVRTRFPQLTELICNSESMDSWDRQYWVNVLPLLEPDQREELRRILVSERDQLSRIDRVVTGIQQLLTEEGSGAESEDQTNQDPMREPDHVQTRSLK